MSVWGKDILNYFLKIWKIWLLSNSRLNRIFWVINNLLWPFVQKYCLHFNRLSSANKITCNISILLTRHEKTFKTEIVSKHALFLNNAFPLGLCSGLCKQLLNILKHLSICFLNKNNPACGWIFFSPHVLVLTLFVAARLFIWRRGLLFCWAPWQVQHLFEGAEDWWTVCLSDLVHHVRVAACSWRVSKCCTMCFRGASKNTENQMLLVKWTVESLICLSSGQP